MLLPGLGFAALLTSSATSSVARVVDARPPPVPSLVSDPPLPIPRPKVLDLRPATPVVPTVKALPPLPPTVVAPPPVEATPKASDSGCLSRLSSHGITAEPTQIGPQADPRCTVVEPVRLGSLQLADGSNMAFPDRPTIACATAETFSSYVRDLLVPLAKGSYGSPVTTVWTGPGLECRTRDRIVGAKLSAHGQGLAVDIAQFKLADGRMIEVGRPKGDLDRAFETAARAGGCGYFHTSLGPGSDAFHETHWHFDLLPRGSTGDAKFCQ